MPWPEVWATKREGKCVHTCGKEMDCSRTKRINGLLIRERREASGVTLALWKFRTEAKPSPCNKIWGGTVAMEGCGNLESNIILLVGNVSASMTGMSKTAASLGSSV